MRITCHTLCGAGRRTVNEDTFRVWEQPDFSRFMAVVSDGMGGHAHGDIASQVVCDTFIRYWEREKSVPDSEEKVQKACHDVCQALNQQALSLKLVKMGATLVMVSIEQDTVTIAHIGDSRCYLSRPTEGMLFQTEDHSLNREGHDSLTRCFFSFRSDASKPDVVQWKLQPGDRLLLCTDGFYKSLSPAVLQEQLINHPSSEQVMELFERMCHRLGKDNYTAVLIDIAP